VISYQAQLTNRNVNKEDEPVWRASMKIRASISKLKCSILFRQALKRSACSGFYQETSATICGDQCHTCMTYLWQMAKSVGPFHRNIMADRKVYAGSRRHLQWYFLQVGLLYMCPRLSLILPYCTASLIQAKGQVPHTKALTRYAFASPNLGSVKFKRRLPGRRIWVVSYRSTPPQS